MMDREQINSEHKERVIHACILAINHAALLVGEPVRQVVGQLTERSALGVADVFKNIKQLTKMFHHQTLTKAEQNLWLAVEKLHHIHSSSASISSRDFEGLLVLLWNGVGECLDIERFTKGEPYEGDGPLLSGEQKFHGEVVRPLILSSVEIVREEEKRFKQERAQERKLQKVAV